MKNAVDEPYFVHESLKADIMFDTMKKNTGKHFAVVIDEYGGVSGIITITDLVEQLVGDFAQAQPNEMSDVIEKTGEAEWTASSIVPLYKVAEAVGVVLPVEEFDTLGAFITANMTEYPKDGETPVIEMENLTVQIIDVKKHRIEKCVIHKKIQQML